MITIAQQLHRFRSKQVLVNELEKRQCYHINWDGQSIHASHKQANVSRMFHFMQDTTILGRPAVRQSHFQHLIITFYGR